MGGAESARYIFVFNILSKVVLFGGGIFIARLLTVDDFGYYLTLSIIFGFIRLFTVSGYEFYYIQNEEEDQSKKLQLLRHVFKLRMYQSLIMFVVCLIIGVLVYLYNDEILGELLLLSAFLFPISLISKPEETYLSKAINFKGISKAKFLNDTSNSLAKVIAAFLGFGPFTFVIGNLVGTTAYNVYLKFNYNIHLFKEKLAISESVNTKRIHSFAFNIFLNNSGSYIKNQLDKLFVASIFNNQDKGIYQFGSSYGGYLFKATITPQTPMVLALMAKNKNNFSYLKKLFDTYGFLVGVSLMPLCIYFMFYTEELLALIFGAKWVESTLVFQIIFSYYVFKFLTYPSNGVLTSIGKPEIKARITLVALFINILVCVFIYFNGFSIVAFAINYISISALVDIMCGIIGMRFIENSYLQFLLDRVKDSSLAIGIGVMLYLVSTTSLNYLVVLFLILTLQLIYVIIKRKRLFESVILLIGNNKILSFLNR